MVNDRVAILREYAKQVKKPVAKCESYDPNVCEFTVDRERLWQFTAVRGTPLSSKLSMEYKGRRLQISANDEYVVISIKASLPTDRFCSINRKNAIFFMAETDLRVGNDPRWPVLIEQGKKATDDLRSLLSSPKLHDVTEQLLSNESRSLHLFRNAISLYFTPSSADELASAVAILSDLVDEVESKDDTESSVIDDLPLEFKDLAGLVQRWAVSDDSERAALLDEASDGELGELVKAVEPRFAAINQYLDSFDDRPMPEAATALGTLAECAAEAQLKLSSRAK
jgi:hypothetical protein